MTFPPPPDDAFIMSDRSVSVHQVMSKIRDLVQKKILENCQETVVTIVDGTHGGKNGISGFSDMACIVQKPYTGEKMIKESVKLISKFRENPDTCNITFQLLDVKDFHFCRRARCPVYLGRSKKYLCGPSTQTYEKRKSQLVDVLKGNSGEVLKWKNGEKHPTNPTEKTKAETTNFLVFGWCYSLNGDVCTALRSDLVMSQLILETNMKMIGIKNVQLSDEQMNFLEKACNKNIKDLFVTGKNLPCT